jgi:DNA invertase Pin-like site-specific DNA recombinase
MRHEARKRKFDILLVWKLDRLNRSLKDLINTLDEFGHLGINFISYNNNLDTTTPTGKLVFQIIGAVAEFEKDITMVHLNRLRAPATLLQLNKFREIFSINTPPLRNG